MNESSIATREIVLTRTLDAPRTMVFEAWTKPEHLANWLCPSNYEVLFVEVDLRIGGRWRSGMRSPDGIEYVAGGRYLEVQRPSRLDFTHSWEDDFNPGHIPGYDTVITVDLAESDGKTAMTFRQAGLTSQKSEDGQRCGWSQALDNLAAFIKNHKELNNA